MIQDLPYLPPIYVLDPYYVSGFSCSNKNAIENSKLLERHQEIMVPEKDMARIRSFVECVLQILKFSKFDDDHHQHCTYFKVIETVGSYQNNVMIKTASGESYLIDIVALIDEPFLTKSRFDVIASRIESTSKNYHNGKIRMISKKNNEANLILAKDDDLQAKINIGLTYRDTFRLPKEIVTEIRDDLISSHFMESRIISLERYRWFYENVTDEVRVLIRLFKDLKQRFCGFMAFDPWMMEVLLHYCVRITPHKVHLNSSQNFSKRSRPNFDNTLSLNDAFLRAFQLLSAGIYLPDSISIKDPILSTGGRWQPIHEHRTDKELDQICCTAQTLLRVMNQNQQQPSGIDYVLGLIGQSTTLSSTVNIEKEMSFWKGGNVVVFPSRPICLETKFAEIRNEITQVVNEMINSVEHQ